MDYPSVERVELYLSKTGQRGSDLLSVLGKQAIFVRAYETELGQQLLKDAISLMEQHLISIVEERATPADMAEFRVLRKIITRWAERIDAYSGNLNKINKVK